jgi:hypothetical protein
MYMGQLKLFLRNLVAIGVIPLVGACSNDDFTELSTEPNNFFTSTVHTVPMKLIGEVVMFDSPESTTRATSSWSDGDKIYLEFYNGSTAIPGDATYSSSAGWSVSYDGELPSGSNLKCEARFFVNATLLSSELVSLNANSEIYEDASATYSYSDGAITVQATLSPKTGRVRFTGTAGANIYTTGISVYTTFSPATNSFTSSNSVIASTVASTGSTPYIYGSFSSSDQTIGLVGDDYAFTRTFSSNILAAGESGYMAIPSETSHNSWKSGLYLKASGVEFKMIPVAGHADGFFMIGETEVTEALYNSVCGTASTSQLPVSSVSYNISLSFIEKLNSETSLAFGLPTLGQWQYAAKGGNKSQGYTYSGSNTPGDVAWYSGNCTSRQNVKTKSPNELGIYDMSGNVEELTCTRLSGYSDPNYYYCGGNYQSSSAEITVESCGHLYYTSNSSYIGLRLILTF